MNRVTVILRYGLVLIIAFVVVAAGLGPAAAIQGGQVELAVDTADFNQDGLLVLFGKTRLGGELGMPTGAGDLNGDGFDDVIFCQMFASAVPRRDCGQINFYMSDGRDSGFVDAAENPPNIFSMLGVDSGDLIGTSVATGDINGDGLSDVALGAAGDDGAGNARFNSGATYVVFGATDFRPPTDLRTIDGTPPPGVMVLYGAGPDCRSGIWVDIGDLDGDGFGDIVMGADQANSDAGQHVGGGCVIFGAPDLPQVIDLSSPPPGVRMTQLRGSGPEEHWGAALHIGDLNDDGFGDLVIGGSIFRDSASYVTPDDPNSGHDARGAGFGGLRPTCGEAYVFYGSANWPAKIDFRNPPANATRVIGANQRDLLGSQIHSGDINGDGNTDLIIGALQALAPDNRGRPGAVHVIYGGPGLMGATVDMADPDASGLRATTIYGEENLDCAGDSVRSFDINGDGAWELFIGSPEHTFTLNGEERDDAGDTKIIFGRREFLPAIVKLYDLPPGLRVFRLAGAHGQGQGVDGGDEMSYRLSGGDVDGDGFIDYIANAMHGDGRNNNIPNTGNVYVFSGKKLSAKLGLLPPDPEPAPELDSAGLFANGQAVQEAFAGQSGLSITVNGEGFRADTEISINGAPVVSRIPNDPQLALTRRTVLLDENLSVRNTVGTLAVRARNTNPPSEPSIEIVAGKLIGPEIASVTLKRKASGVLLLKVRGANFQVGSTATVLTQSGQQVNLKSAAFNRTDFGKLKIAPASVPLPGTLIRIRVISPNGIQSNEVTATTL